MPVDFDAIDGKPVDIVFAIVAPTAHDHLLLLGRLAHALHDQDFHRALLAREGSGLLLQLARAAEAKLVSARRESNGGERA